MDDEQRKTMQVPSLYANRFFMTRMTNGVRIAFGETIDGEAFYSGAMMMSDADALALRDLLISMFPPADRQN
jgi:hypothetical protein